MTPCVKELLHENGGPKAFHTLFKVMCEFRCEEDDNEEGDKQDYIAYIGYLVNTIFVHPVVDGVMGKATS